MTDLLDGLSPRSRTLLVDIGRLAARRGEEVYLVGGTVRDLVLGRPSEDLDVVVVGDGLDLAQALSRALHGQLTRHHAFQTARVDLEDGLRVDVATARGEDYSRPGQLPRVRRGSLQEDLARRDFTINAIALCLLPDRLGEIVDPFEGLADIDRGRVRFLHEGSFVDDPTRMLRGIRFCLRFGYELASRTAEALEHGVQGRYLDDVSGDRLRREVAKLFDEAPVRGPEALRDHALLDALHPGLVADASALDRLQRETHRYRDEMGQDAGGLGPGWTRVLGVLARPLAPQPRWELVRRLRLSKEQRRPVIEAGAAWGRARSRLAELPEAEIAGVVEVIRELGDDALLVILAGMGPGDEIRSLLREAMWRRRRVSVSLNGDDLIAMGCSEGPRLGELLDTLLRARLRGEVRSEEEERALVRRELQIDRSEAS